MGEYIIIATACDIEQYIMHQMLQVLSNYISDYIILYLCMLPLYFLSSIYKGAYHSKVYKMQLLYRRFLLDTDCRSQRIALITC